jgi:hypothetical protein
MRDVSERYCWDGIPPSGCIRTVKLFMISNQGQCQGGKLFGPEFMRTGVWVKPIGGEQLWSERF